MKIHLSSNNVSVKKKNKEKQGSISKLGEEIPSINNSVFKVWNILSQETGKCINSSMTRFSDDLPGMKPTKHTAGQCEMQSDLTGWPQPGTGLLACGAEEPSGQQLAENETFSQCPKYQGCAHSCLGWAIRKISSPGMQSQCEWQGRWEMYLGYLFLDLSYHLQLHGPSRILIKLSVED